jgi:hypothetical protein
MRNTIGGPGCAAVVGIRSAATVIVRPGRDLRSGTMMRITSAGMVRPS